MKRKFEKTLYLLFIALFIILSIPVNVMALTGNGTGSGSINYNTTSGTAFVVSSAQAINSGRPGGYRFTIVDEYKNEV